MSGATLTEAAPSPGYFGKLPARGDFVARQLPRSFLEPWDKWLQTAMTASRQQLGDAWLEHYLVSPVWHFTLSAGICGESAYAGVLMPSVDRVGRYFPLTIAAPLHQASNLLELVGNEWFECAEQVGLAGLDEQLEPEEFDERVKALGLPGDVSHLSDAAVASGPAWHYPLTGSTNPSSIASELAGHFLRWRFSNFSLWWSHGSEHIAPCLLTCQGLPPAEGFAALLAGGWARWGWCERPLSVGGAPAPTIKVIEESL